MSLRAASLLFSNREMLICCDAATVFLPTSFYSLSSYCDPQTKILVAGVVKSLQTYIDPSDREQAERKLVAAVRQHRRRHFLLTRYGQKLSVAHEHARSDDVISYEPKEL